MEYVQQQIPAKTASRLGKMIRLLSSTADGEALAAARGISRVLEGQGLSLNEFATIVENRLTRAPGQEQSEERRQNRHSSERGHRKHWGPWRRSRFDDLDKVVEASKHDDLLRRKDYQFIYSLWGQLLRGKRLSAKQKEWLDDIWDRLETAGAV
jgi:hypothetical protein